MTKQSDMHFIYLSPYLRCMLQLCDSVLRLQKLLFKVGMEATKSKASSFIPSFVKQTYPESTQNICTIGVEDNQGNRIEKIGLGRKVNRRRRRCTKAGSYRHCGKTGHKKNSCWKNHPELIPDRYKSQEREAPPTFPKLPLLVGKKRLC